jgi:predicted RNase H-like nuclease (RuvC/YqgF family)
MMEPLEEVERVEIHRAGSAEQGGWVSRRFGRKVPGTTVVWQSRVTGVTVLRTRLTYQRSRPIGV